MDSKVGSFNITTGTDDVEVTGVGFEPKAIIFFSSGRTESTDAIGEQNSIVNIGFATSASDFRVHGTIHVHDATGTNSASEGRNDACVLQNAMGGAVGWADLKSVNSDGFVLEILDQFTVNMRVGYIALGGSDLTNAATGAFVATATATQDITDLAFQPDCVIMTNICRVDSSYAQTARMSFGASSGSSNNALVAYWDRSQDPADTYGYAVSGRCVATMNQAGTLDGEGHLSAFLSNGFTIAWDNQPTGSFSQIYYLALKGGDYEVGDLLTRTDTNNIEETVGFAPTGVLFASHCRAENTIGSPNAECEFSVGAASATVSRLACGLKAEDGASPTDVTAAIEHDEVYVNISSASAVEGLMDLTSLTSPANGFTCKMDDTDPSAAFVWYLAFGPAPSGTPDLLNLTGYGLSGGFQELRGGFG